LKPFAVVRNIVATLRYVGNGKISPDQVKVMLDARSRSVCYKAAPAKGLFLTEVGFWGEDGDDMKSYDEWVRERPHEMVRFIPVQHKMLVWPSLMPKPRRLFHDADSKVVNDVALAGY
jgi:hypothetical protein